MELRQLECFVALAEELHFGRAAARMRITQPPLSRQIKQLEDDLGLLLFERSSRQVKMTPAGHSFVQDARHLLEYSARATKNAKRAFSNGAGRITLGYTAVSAYRLLPEMLTAARKELPNLEIKLREMVTSDLTQQLLAGALDVALLRAVPAQPHIQKTLLLREPMIVALPKDHPLERLDTIHLQDLHRQPLVYYDPSDGKYFYDRLAGALALLDVQPNYVQAASQTLTMLTLVRAGLGIGVVPASSTELRLEGVVFRPLISDPPMHADIYIAWNTHLANPALSGFLERVAMV